MVDHTVWFCYEGMLIGIHKLGFDHRAGHFRPPGMAEGIDKLPVLQGLRCFYVGPSSVGVAGATIKAPKGLV